MRVLKYPAIPDNPSEIAVCVNKDNSERLVDLREIKPNKKTAEGYDYAKLSQNEMFDILQFSIFSATTGKIKSEKFMRVIEQIISYLHAKGEI